MRKYTGAFYWEYFRYFLDNEVFSLVRRSRDVLVSDSAGTKWWLYIGDTGDNSDSHADNDIETG